MFQARDTSSENQGVLRTDVDISLKSRRKHIVRTFLRHGLALVFRQHGLALFRNGGVTLTEAEKSEIALNLRRAFEELGPTFIKMGQVLSTRHDILPDFICDEFTYLLDSVEPAPFSEVAAILQRELPKGLDAFHFIQREPIGSASLAMVYLAELKTGQRCAVKVVRPYVDRLFQTDIQLIKRWAARIYRRLPERVQSTVDFRGLLEDYWSSSIEECDMRQEAEHMAHHAEMMQVYERVRVPRVYLPPSKNVLVMEYIDGWTLKDFPVEEVTFEERFHMMFDLGHYYIESLLNGYYHADCHAANILIDKADKTAVVIDWGMVGRMDVQTAQKLLYMVSLINQNLCEEAAEVGLQILEPTEYTKIDEIRKKFVAMAPKYAFATQGQTKVNWGTVVTEVIQAGVQNFCRIPSGLALWTKGWMATEATARWLLPEVSYHRIVESYDTNILRNMLSHQMSYKTNGFVVAETARLATTLPRRLNSLLEKAALNRLGGYMEIRLSERANRSLNGMVNRVALAAVCSISFLASSVAIISLHWRISTVVNGFIGGGATAMAAVGLLSGMALIRQTRKSHRQS